MWDKRFSEPGFAYGTDPNVFLTSVACLRGLAPGGVFVLEGFTPPQLELGTGGPKSRELLMELEIIRQELPGLRLEIARELEREVTEGKYHHGTVSVVQILAVK